MVVAQLVHPAVANIVNSSKVPLAPVAAPQCWQVASTCEGPVAG